MPAHSMSLVCCPIAPCKSKNNCSLINPLASGRYKVSDRCEKKRQSEREREIIKKRLKHSKSVTIEVGVQLAWVCACIRVCVCTRMWINDQLRLICQRIHKPWSWQGAARTAVIPVRVQALRSSCFAYIRCIVAVYIAPRVSIYLYVSVNCAQALESDFNWNRIVQDHPKRSPITYESHLDCLPERQKTKKAELIKLPTPVTPAPLRSARPCALLAEWAI